MICYEIARDVINDTNDNQDQYFGRNMRVHVNTSKQHLSYS